MILYHFWVYSLDNMHVDEVQINSGGTEAVITGNMENPGKRLIVLEGDAVEALYGRPRFTHEERVQYFALSQGQCPVMGMSFSERNKNLFAGHLRRDFLSSRAW